MHTAQAQPTSQTAVPFSHKVFFAAVGVLAVWVGIWGFFLPAHVDQTLPWSVPPLHARFLGSIYLSGSVMIVVILARRGASARVITPMIAIWTGMLFIVSLFYLQTFNWARAQTWVWFGAYLIYPLIALYLFWSQRGHVDDSGPALSTVLRAYLLVQGSLVTLLALCLLLLPGNMVTLWPWAITPMLAQLYSAPFLSFGLGSLYAARQRVFAHVQILLLGIFVLGIFVLLASLLHLALFSVAHIATWLWFLGFGVVTGATGIWLAAPALVRRQKPTALSH
jgi:hypothetical protein